MQTIGENIKFQTSGAGEGPAPIGKGRAPRAATATKARDLHLTPET